MTTPTPLGSRMSLIAVAISVGQALLHLQPTGIHLRQPRQLAEADDLLGRQVGDVHPAVERQQVVLAEAVHFHVAHDDHLVVVRLEQGVTHDRSRVDSVAGRKEGPAAGNA